MNKKNEYRVIEDPQYGYLRVDPIPSKKDVDEFYLQEFYSSHNTKFNDSSLEVQREEKEFFNTRWESILYRCKEYFGNVEGLSMFDIGAGYCQALLYFREKDINVCGLEPSQEGADYARKQGIEIFQNGIEDFDCVGSKRFDIVTLLNVLEHLRHPYDILVDIKRKLLKPGGLLIIDVPNDFNDFQVAANAEYNLKEWWVCPPKHINYFSVSSLTNLLERAGYIVHYKESSFPLEMFLLMGDVYVGASELGKECHRKRVHFENVLRKQGKGERLEMFYQSLADLNLGRQVVVYAISKLR